MRRHVLLATLLAAGCAEGGGTSTQKEAPKKEVPKEKAASMPAKEKVMGFPVDEPAFKAMHELKAEQAPKHRGKMVEIGGGQHYLSLPEGEGPHPAVVVVHEWWGLNSHIKHYADRLAAVGYAALAVDLYGGKTADNPDDAAAMMKAVDRKKAVATMQSGHAYLVDEVKAPKTGVIGWCFGGAMSLQLAIAQPELDAAVMYYGFPVLEVDVLKEIEAPLLGIFANADDFIPPDKVDAFEAALKKAEANFEILRFDAVHAFANPSNAKYDGEAAAKAWNEASDWLSKNLK